MSYSNYLPHYNIHENLFMLLLLSIISLDFICLGKIILFALNPYEYRHLFSLREDFQLGGNFCLVVFVSGIDKILGNLLVKEFIFCRIAYCILMFLDELLSNLF